MLLFTKNNLTLVGGSYNYSTSDLINEHCYFHVVCIIHKLVFQTSLLLIFKAEK